MSNDKIQPNDDLTATEEQVLDALLAEVLADASPPNLSREILSQLRALPDHASGVARSSDGSPAEADVTPSGIVPGSASRRGANSRRPLSPEKGGRRKLTLVLSLAAALAAVFLLMFSLRHRDGEVGPEQQVAGVDAENQRDDTVGSNDPVDGTDLADSRDDSPSRPPRGIPLVVEPLVAENSEASPDTVDPRKVLQTPAGDLPDVSRPTPRSSAAEMTLVSAGVNDDLRKYWQAIGIDSGEAASPDEAVRRLAAALDIQLPTDSIGDAEAIRRELSRPKVARAVATRWLQLVTRGGLNRLSPEAKQAWVKELAESFRGKSGVDRLIADWAGGKSDQMSAFYTAFAAGGEHQMVRQLGSLTMNVDLRCVRCHDALIEGNGRQDDYWSFAAFLRKGLHRDADRWSLPSEPKQKSPVFYALPDGRQRVAEPVVAERWSTPGEAIADVATWSRSLVGSPQLARGVVNSLWQLVHGQPLQGRVIDPVTAPHDASLDHLHQRLTDDLLDSGFDVGRTLSMIIASPATDRRVPDALLPENSLATREAVQAAMERVNAFAAAVPTRQRTSLNRRIDIAMNRIGAKIDPVNAVLAQPSSDGSSDASSGSKPPSDRPKPGGDFPGRAHASYPVQWLSSVPGKNSRIEHLGYLASMTEVPQGVVEAAEAFREADESEALSLQRVWWLLRP